jgi:hypothetical protein
LIPQGTLVICNKSMLHILSNFLLSFCAIKLSKNCKPYCYSI